MRRMRQLLVLATMGASVILSLATTVVNAQEPPVLQETGSGTFVLDFPNTPMPTYELSFADPEDWPGEDRLRSYRVSTLGAPDALEILSIDPEERRVILRTTRFAARTGFNSIGGELKLIEEAGPEVQCARIVANLNLEDVPNEGEPTAINWARPDGDCAANRQVDWERNVIVEGKSRDGASLYYVTARDPRWYLRETFTEEGHPIHLGHGKYDWPDMTLTIFAPAPDDLHLLRVWEMNADGEMFVIGDIPFVVPEWRE